MAPEPRDILWDNITKVFNEKIVRSVIINACVWTLTIFWLFPILAFLALTTVDSLSNIKFLKPLIETAPIIRSLIQNVLPTLLVTFFMSFLPWILMELSKQERFPSYSELEEAVLIRYYNFCIFNVFIVFLLGSTFLINLFTVINQPTSIISLLANALPKGATFFINYVIFNICTHGFELVQVGSQLFLHIILTSRFIATTPRMLQRVTHPWSFPFYYYYPNHILVFVVTVTYSVINPLILVFAVLYYGFALIVFKHQFAYCYVRRYETGGKFYRRLFRYTTDGLIIFQLTIIGIIWLNKAITIGGMLTPLLVGTGYFKYYCYKTFYSRTHYLALDSRLQDNQENEQSDQVNVDVNESENLIPAISTETFHNEKENMESDTVIASPSMNENATNNSNKEDDVYNSMESDTSTKIASNKNIEDIRQKKPLDIVKTSSKQNEGHLSIETNDTLVNSSCNTNDDNDNTKLPKISLIQGGDSLGSSKTQLKSKKDNKLTIIPPDNNSFLNIPVTASPIESMSEHDSRLPSAGNSRNFHKAHFTHDPNLKVLQDETSTYQTYTHPNLIKALNRKLWLPRNPLTKICIEDNVELSKALISSKGGNRLVGYWGGASQYLREAKVSAHGIHEFPVMNEEETEVGGNEGECQNPRKYTNNESDEESDCSFQDLPDDDHIVSSDEEEF